MEKSSEVHTIFIPYRDIILRDYCEADIEDEIRWMNTEIEWMKADTPWETFEPVDEAELRSQMLEMMRSMPLDALRWRLEIEKDGKHIGFVCSYFLDGDSESVGRTDEEDDVPVGVVEKAGQIYPIRALGIEICEPSYWGQGIGTQALTAFMNYYRSKGENCFALETWSGNLRMVRCAEKLGFVVSRRITASREVEGKFYDALTFVRNV